MGALHEDSSFTEEEATAIYMTELRLSDGILSFYLNEFYMMEGDRDFVRSWRNVTEVNVKGGHMVTEDAPDDVGLAISKWFQETHRA